MPATGKQRAFTITRGRGPKADAPHDPVGTDDGWELRWRTMHTASEDLVCLVIPRLLRPMARRHGGVEPLGQDDKSVVRVNFERACAQRYEEAVQAGRYGEFVPNLAAEARAAAPVPEEVMPDAGTVPALADATVPEKEVMPGSHFIPTGTTTPAPEVPSPAPAHPARTARAPYRPEYITVPFSPDEATALRRIAAGTGRGVTACIRALVAEAAGDAPPTSTPPADGQPRYREEMLPQRPPDGEVKSYATCGSRFYPFAEALMAAYLDKRPDVAQIARRALADATLFHAWEVDVLRKMLDVVEGP